jgi:hypothetical protein
MPSLRFAHARHARDWPGMSRGGAVQQQQHVLTVVSNFRSLFAPFAPFSGNTLTAFPLCWAGYLLSSRDQGPLAARPSHSHLHQPDARSRPPCNGSRISSHRVPARAWPPVIGRFRFGPAAISTSSERPLTAGLYRPRDLLMPRQAQYPAAADHGLPCSWTLSCSAWRKGLSRRTSPHNWLRVRHLWKVRTLSGQMCRFPGVLQHSYA